MKKAITIFLLAIFLFSTGYASVSYISKVIGNKKFCAIQNFDCAEENKSREKEDGKEGEKEGGKGTEKEFPEYVFNYENPNSAALTQTEFFRQSRLGLSSAGYSGEIFSPPEQAAC